MARQAPAYKAKSFQSYGRSTRYPLRGCQGTARRLRVSGGSSCVSASPGCCSQASRPGAIAARGTLHTRNNRYIRVLFQPGHFNTLVCNSATRPQMQPASKSHPPKIRIFVSPTAVDQASAEWKRHLEKMAGTLRFLTFLHCSIRVIQFRLLRCMAVRAWDQRIYQKGLSVFTSHFYGQYKKTVSCDRCSRISITFPLFLYVDLSLHARDPNPLALGSLLARYGGHVVTVVAVHSVLAPLHPFGRGSICLS